MAYNGYHSAEGAGGMNPYGGEAEYLAPAAGQPRYSEDPFASGSAEPYSSLPMNEDPEMVDLSGGQRPLSGAIGSDAGASSAYWQPGARGSVGGIDGYDPAHEWDEPAGGEPLWRRRRWVVIAAVLGGIAVLAVALGVGLGVGLNKANGNNVDNAAQLKNGKSSSGDPRPSVSVGTFLYTSTSYLSDGRATVVTTSALSTSSLPDMTTSTQDPAMTRSSPDPTSSCPCRAFIPDHCIFSHITLTICACILDYVSHLAIRFLSCGALLFGALLVLVFASTVFFLATRIVVRASRILVLASRVLFFRRRDLFGIPLHFDPVIILRFINRCGFKHFLFFRALLCRLVCIVRLVVLGCPVLDLLRGLFRRLILAVCLVNGCRVLGISVVVRAGLFCVAVIRLFGCGILVILAVLASAIVQQYLGSSRDFFLGDPELGGSIQLGRELVQCRSEQLFEQRRGVLEHERGAIDSSSSAAPSSSSTTAPSSTTSSSSSAAPSSTTTAAPAATTTPPLSTDSNGGSYTFTTRPITSSSSTAAAAVTTSARPTTSSAGPASSPSSSSAAPAASSSTSA
ncbi:hypothetical protein JCM8202_000878 [Rhodotorula sphaerocarpa]